MKSSKTKAASKTKSKSKVNEAGNYTQPGLRKSLYEKIKAGNKGGKSNSWSAIKSMILAKEYKKATKGKGYKD
jgi:hypothetical protein